jgi:hypothetical protein
MTAADLNRRLMSPEARRSAETHCPHCGTKIVPQHHRPGGSEVPHCECGTGCGEFPQSTRCEEREADQVFEKPIFIWAQKETK